MAVREEGEVTIVEEDPLYKRRVELWERTEGMTPSELRRRASQMAAEASRGRCRSAVAIH